MKIISKVLFIVLVVFSISVFGQNQQQNNNGQKLMKKRMMHAGRRKGSHFLYKNLEKRIFEDLKIKYPKISKYLKDNPRSKARMKSMRQFFKRSGRLLLHGKEEESYAKLLTMLKLNIEIEMNTKKYHNSSVDEKKNIEQILRKEITTLFGLREKMRHKIIEDLEKRLKEEKSKYDLRQKNKSEIIEKRLHQFIGKKDDLSW